MIDLTKPLGKKSSRKKKVDKLFGISGYPITKDVVRSGVKQALYLVPGFGTGLAANDMYHEPNILNGIGLALSLLGDAGVAAKEVGVTGKDISKAVGKVRRNLGNFIGFGNVNEDAIRELFPAISAERQAPNIMYQPKWINPQSSNNLALTDIPNIRKITKDNIADITDAQWDATYNAAYARGDELELKRLRELHYRSKSPNNKLVSRLPGREGTTWPLYHETNAYFNSFGPPGRHSSTDVLSPPGIFLKNSDIPIGLGDNQLRIYGTMENPLKVENKRELLRLLPSNLQEDILHFLTYDKPLGKTQEVLHKAKKLRFRLSKYLNSKGFDGLRIVEDWAGSGLTPNDRWTPSFIFPTPYKLKFAAPVTYDDFGKIIPLSKRDNFTINDLRYGLLPTIGLGTGAYLKKNLGTTSPSDVYKTGGTIHINPANRGKFTATMKRTGKTAEELSHSSNPLTRKRAIFALNARKWNK